MAATTIVLRVQMVYQSSMYGLLLVTTKVRTVSHSIRFRLMAASTGVNSVYHNLISWINPATTR